ncbi:hypothetical protein [Nocardia asteroides]|uniref:hypothetical protein n=1 Tax=Nocardia asteroides TaxID=1824 RepID=UPI0034395E5F
MTAALPKARQQASANERLRDAVFNAQMTPEQLAETVEVDPKTVQRWIAQGRIPYPVHQHAVAVALGVPEKELWPNGFGPSRFRSRTRPAAPAPEFEGERPGGTAGDGTAFLDLLGPKDRMRELMSWVPEKRSALADHASSGNALADALARQAERDAAYDR